MPIIAEAVTRAPAVLGLPFIESRRADTVLAADLRRRNPSLLLPQHRDDLLFRKPQSLHGPSLSLGRPLVSPGGVSGGHVRRQVPAFTPDFWLSNLQRA